MTANPDFRIANAADLADIQGLLKQAGLPFEDLSAVLMPDFVVLRGASGELFAAGGVEIHGEDGLLRSIVVAEAMRGKGLGETVTMTVERHARTKGVRALFLLTTTAADFFPRLGYERFDRGSVPTALAGSAEFASLCPASAICMKKNLE